ITWTLAKLGVSEATDPIVHAFSTGRLQAFDDFDAKIITRAIGIERLATDELMNHDREAVRVLTAHALAEAASAEIVEPLGRMLTSELARPERAPEGEEAVPGSLRSEEVLRAAASGLGRSNDPRAAQPLFSMLQQAPGMRNSAFEALGKSTAAPGLATLLTQARDPEVVSELVRLVAATHDERGADALAGVLENSSLELEPDIRATAAFALAQVGDRRAVPTLLVVARLEEEEGLAREAIDHLGMVANSEDTGAILSLLDAFPGYNADLLRTLGKTRDPAALRRLLQGLQGDDVGAAAMAVADLGQLSAYREMLSMAARPRDVEMTAVTAADRSVANERLLTRRKAAIRSLGQFGRNEENDRQADQAYDALKTIVEDELDDYELRQYAAASIGMIATLEQMGEVLDRINDPEATEATRAYYVQALWQASYRELGSRTMALITSDGPLEMRRSAAVAVGYSADPANDAQLITLLEAEATRREAAIAIVLGGGAEAGERLLAMLGEDSGLREILQGLVMNNINDWFNLVTEEMFENGAIWRRLRVAEILAGGDENGTYGYPWAKALAVLKSGWDASGGARPLFIRHQVYQAMSNEDEDVRRLAAKVLLDLPERGLLLRARDDGGLAEAAARSVLRQDRQRSPD
ncbi:MAG: HEAT repeat domain-containing protein, partial [Myxococcales bacterium]|nr:HEAT repeat domain-containing protein [Myxococcales bacterium]